MSRRRSEAGDGKLGCIIWLLLVAIGIMIGWKAIPVKIASSELYDFMVEQAKWAGGATTDAIAKSIVVKAKELELPVDPKDVKVEKNGDRIIMHVIYTVPLDFPGYTYEWRFDHRVDRNIYLW